MNLSVFGKPVVAGALGLMVAVTASLLLSAGHHESGHHDTGSHGAGSHGAGSVAAERAVTESAATDGSVKTVTIHLTDREGIGADVGTATLEDSGYGLIITPDLAGLTPGVHGFHIHVNPACGPGEKDGNVVPGLAAGGHFDPEDTGYHGGPYGNGHLGDLPPLFVDHMGVANVPVLAPRLTVAQVANRSLMVHMHGDNFSDEPAPLGGGGPRLACGVIE